MIDLNDRLEQIASICAAREVYNQYLYMLLEHLEVIVVVNNGTKTKKPLQMLAECYAIASVSSSGDRKDQSMYDILREIAYQTALNKEVVIYKVEPLSFTATHASALINKAWESSRKIIRNKNI